MIKINSPFSNLIVVTIFSKFEIRIWKKWEKQKAGAVKDFIKKRKLIEFRKVRPTPKLSFEDAMTQGFRSFVKSRMGEEGLRRRTMPPDPLNLGDKDESI